MNRSIRLPLACLALPLAFAISSCGDGLDLPTSGSGGGATPTPTTAPTATPAPTPTPTATPGAASCTLPPRPDCGNNGCCFAGGTRLFDNEIEAAQADLRRTNPNIFDGGGNLRIEEIEYTDLLAARIMSMNPGLCARGGGRPGESISKDEVGIKRDNNRSQNVDVILGSGGTWLGNRYTCEPASF